MDIMKGILIVGNESALSGALEVEAAKRVEHYSVALITNRLSGEDEKPNFQLRRENSSSAASAAGTSPEKARIPLEWNPGSPISARTLVLAAENRLGQIDDAILVCDPPSIRRAAADIDMTDVEVLVNDHIKGWFFLIKDLTAFFRTKGKGTLALICPEISGSGGKDEIADLLGPAALASFRSLTRGLLAAALSEPYLTLGFSGAEAGDETGFAAFVFKQLDEGNRRTNGKLYKYGKLGFFR
jgi:hypothetical protein